jgi:hypothetical protein
VRLAAVATLSHVDCDMNRRAVGMAICLRSYVYHFRRGRYVIPVQLAKEYGLKVIPHLPQPFL